MEKTRYRTYSKYLVEKYGEKVYKLPVNLPGTCPNRDGIAGEGGCIFCGEVAAGFESLCNQLPVKDQLNTNKENISKKYKAKKFIAYFQNFSNTYMPLDDFEKSLREACIEDVVELCISTRPDCINDAYLEVMDRVSRENGVEITVELGLQSTNINTLIKINRGHGLAEFIDAVLRIKPYHFEICVHLIANLPWDTENDFLEAGRILTALGIRQVKIHSLYILKDTILGDMYENNEFEIITPEAYVDRVVEFVRIVDKDMVFQRFAGRAPAEETLFCNWDMSWWRLKDMIDEQLEALDIVQGQGCNYLNGAAVGTFLK